MHPLFERQLREVTAADGQVDLERLSRQVSRAYEEADRERRIKDRAFDEMQREVEGLNRRIHQDVEARFNVVMNNVGEAVIIIDEKGIIESFNLAAEKIFGYSAEEVIGRNVTILMTEEEAGHHDAAMANYLRTRQPKIIGTVRESRGQRKDGEVFPLELGVGEVATGPRRNFIGIIRDISQRKRAEQQLRESEGRFRDLAGSASDWFWETDAEHRLTFLSERISSVLGVKPSALLGCGLLDLLQGDETTMAEHMEELAQQRSFRDRLFHVGPPEGHDSHFIRISGIPVFADDGAFLGYRGVGVDITREVAAEQRARKAQQLLADAIDRMVDGLSIHDANDRLVLFNRQYKKVFTGLGERIGTGASFEEVVRAHPEAIDTEGRPFEDWIRQRLDHHRAASGEPMVVRLSDGRWTLLREFRMADGGTVGLGTDITALKHHEQALEELRRRYRLILDSAGEGIVGVNATGRIIFANRKAAELLGHTPEAMVDRSFHEFVRERDTDGHSPVRRAYEGGSVGEGTEDLFLRSDGSTLPVDYFAAPLTEGGEVAGAVVLFRDATLRLKYERGLADSRKELERQVAERTRDLTREVNIRARTEGALRESRKRLKSVTDSLFEGVLVINRSGLVTFANPSARALLAIEGDPEGLPVDSLAKLGGIPFTDSPWRTVVNEGSSMRDDAAAFVTTDGKTLDVAYACSAIEVEEGIKAVVVSFRDITELKRAQREALQASRMASVGQLAAGIAHEINTPIQYIGDNLRFISDSIGAMVGAVDAGQELAEKAVLAGFVGPAAEFASACEAADVPYLRDELPKAVSQSLDGVAQVARIVLSMKEFSHPGSSSKTMVDINRAIENTLTVSRNTWKHVAEVVRDFDPLPPIPCYPGELNQVFLNLIVNACHAIEAGHKDEPGVIHISTEREGDDVVIRVADNGPGIPAAIRDRIFDPFFTTKDVGKGTGQGLAICRDVVVAKHGGRIEVNGREGKGAVFTVRLPINAVDDERPVTAEERA